MTDPACTCGHSIEEHAKAPNGSRAECTAEGCGCIAYEAEEMTDE